MHSINRTLTIQSALAVFALGASIASAVPITGVTIEGFSTEFPGREAVNSVNGSGFTEASGFHSTDFNDNWLTGVGDIANAFITYDLEANYNLESIKIWNNNNLTNRGVRNATLSVASSEGGSFTALTTLEINSAPVNDSIDFGHLIDLSAFTAANDVRLFRIDVNTNWGDGSHTGLSEVRFESVPPVPEPSSFLVMGICLSFGLVRARRQKKRKL